MRIDRVILKNFKGFAAFEVKLDPHFNLFVGDNASGKTSVLDAVKIGLDSWFIGMKADTGIGSIDQDEVHVIAYQRQDQDSFEKQFPSRVEFHGSVMGDLVVWSRELASERGRTTSTGSKALAKIAQEADRLVRANGDVTLPLVCAYGTERLWYETLQRQRASKKEPSHKLPSRFDGYRNCTSWEIQETDFLRWMRAQTSASRQLGSDTIALSAMNEAILACVEGAEKVYYDERYDDLIVVTKEHGRQLFRTLSDGQRIMLTLIGDIARRAIALNPHLSKEVLHLTPGVVSIDELDLHLHAKWQRRVIRDLKATFPLVQFIATTHSPQLVGEALPQEIRILEKGHAITPPRSFGVDSSRILEEVMHVSRRNDETDALLSRMAREIDAENLDDAKKTLVEVEAKLGKDDPDVTGANSLIGLLEATE